MTLNGIMALILRYFTEYVVLKQLWRLPICAIIQRLFGQNKLW